MRTLVCAVLLILGCGDPHGGNSGPDATGGGRDAGDGDGGPDGGDDVDAPTDAGTVLPGDGGITTGCTQPRKPTSVTTMTGFSGLNYVHTFTAGGRAYATKTPASATAWLRWTGTGWSEEPIPWPSNLTNPQGISTIVQLSSGKVLVRSNQYLMTFDGTTMSPAIQMPVGAGWAYTQDPDGAYHVFHGALESVSRPDGTWYPAAPVPVQKLSAEPTATATVMADGRVVVLWLDQVFGANEPIHAHVISRRTGENWTAPLDITPTWAVRAQWPYAYAPPGGGVVLGVTGTSGVGAVLWRSADGLTYGDYEPLGLINVTGVAGPCLDALVATAGYQTRYDLLKLDGSTWSILETRSINYIDDARVAMLPDGRTFWTLGETGRAEYFATP